MMSFDGVKFEVLCDTSDVGNRSTKVDAEWSEKTQGWKDFPRRYMLALSRTVSPEDLGHIIHYLLSDSGENDALDKEISACNSVFDVLFLYVQLKNLAPWWNWRKIRELQLKILPPYLKLRPADVNKTSELKVYSRIQEELKAYFDERTYHMKVDDKNALVVLTDNEWEDSEDYQNLSSFLAADDDEPVEKVVFCPISLAAPRFDILLRHESDSFWQDVNTKPTVTSDSESDSECYASNLEDELPLAEKCRGSQEYPCNFVLPFSHPIPKDINKFQCSECGHLANCIASDSLACGIKPVMKHFN